MTNYQCHILSLLLKQDHFLMGMTVYDKKISPVARIHHRTFLKIKKYLRKKGHVHVIDKRVIRGLHGRCWIKKEYRKLLLEQKNTNHARS